MKLRFEITLTLLFSTFYLLPSAFGQGSLTPPGAPAPTMKTLNQIDAKLEKRTPITSLPITITQPGSYYLTGSFDLAAGQDGIFVSAQNVTIDLNGFTIRSFDPANTTVGIRIDPLGSAMSDLTIRNGHIVGTVLFTSSGTFGGNGFGYGIYCAGSPRNVHIVDVTVSGCLNDGINIGVNSTVVESCAVSTVGGNGIVADAVSRCTAYQCGMNGIQARTASECSGDSVQTPYSGISAHVATSCYGTGVGVGGFSHGSGISADVANNCWGYDSSVPPGGDGVFAILANNCYGYNNGSGYGVFANVANNCFGWSNTGTGVDAVDANNCEGDSNGAGDAIDARNAHNCDGTCNGSGAGISANTVEGCFGDSSSGYGIYALDIASVSYGFSDNGTGLWAFIANSCDGTSLTVTHKYNMP
jgi:hypothetical protein